MATINESKPNVLLIVPRYFSTRVCGYIMPLGILYVSAALKASGVANVYTVNLNHQEEDSNRGKFWYFWTVYRGIPIDEIDKTN